MFYIDKNTELSNLLLQKYMNRFTVNDLPILQKWDRYYNGLQAIINKQYNDESKPCSRIVTNYCRVITNTYAGYIVGKPVSYTSNDDIDEVQNCINYNDTNAEDMQFLTNALNYGRAYELFWMDEGANIRFGQISPLAAFPIYGNTLDSELLYFIRWFKGDSFEDSSIFFVEVYSANTIKTYKMVGLNGNLTFIDEKPHYFGNVPVSVFTLNQNEENIFNPIITLNDAYNELQSSEIDDYSAWVDSYLCITGGDIDEEGIDSMKENRCLVLPDGSKAEYLTKNASDTQINNLLENIRKNIFKVTACPDMSDENFLAQSGTALAYKLTGFENCASSIAANMTKALQKRIELVCNILNLKSSEAVWRDIQINFTRNLPINLVDTIQLVNALKGTVSDATLLAQLPFIKDVNAELEAIQKQKENNMAMFNFGSTGSEEEEEE